MNPRDKICFALDVNNLHDARMLITEVHPYVGYIKIGMEAFYSFGNEVLSGIQSMNERLGGQKLKVMLDLKLHDIPATVARSTAVLAKKYKFDYLTAHCGDSPNALKELTRCVDVNKIVGITVLTSVEWNGVQHYHNLYQYYKDQSPGTITDNDKFSINDLIRRRIRAAHTNTGIKTFVCSGKDLPKLKENLGELFDKLDFITPGVRSLRKSDDQARVTTPAQAIKNGSHLLVIGREIRDAPDPAEAAKKILNDVKGVLNG